MNRKMLVALLVAAAMVPLAPSGIASHPGWYASNPVEHDDQGRSNEPDFRTTSVLGPTLQNKVIDTNLDGVAVPDSGLGTVSGDLAPGCTDDTGKRPSGLCGLWTIGVGWSNGAYVPGAVPPKTAGVQGMSGTSAPGAFTPTKGTPVRFLDAIQNFQAQTVGSTYLELNRKVDDSGLRAVLTTADANFGKDVLIGPSAVWAWYGKWQDKNGNGVIDATYHGTLANQPPASVDDEFVWMGNCNAFPDVPNPGSVAAGFCAYDEDYLAGGTTRMLSYQFPGNHHAYNGGYSEDGLVCALCQTPSDIPGRQAYHLLSSVVPELCVENQPSSNGIAGPVCGTSDPRQFDLNDEQVFGDPLLGTQTSVAPDGSYHDRSGEPSVVTRQWVHGVGWQTYYYDDGLLVTLVSVAAVGCKQNDASQNQYDLATCRFADVDFMGGINPLAEQFVSGTLRPTARSNWVSVRTAWTPFSSTIDGLRNNKAADTSIALGPVNDAVQDPGWSREPNNAADAFAGAVRGVCIGTDAGDRTHLGFCNNYAAQRTAAHAFGDVQFFRAATVLRPIGSGGCIACVAGVGAGMPYAGEAPGPIPVRADGDHGRTLGAGQYVIGGVFGNWQDKAQTWDEEFVDATCATTPVNALGTCGSVALPAGSSPNIVRRNTYTAAADGWVGNVVNATGTWYYRGYVNEACVTDQGSLVKPYGQCHPLLDGAINDAQQFSLGPASHAEFVGRCDEIVGDAIVLHPVDGTWTIPIFVWRNHFAGVDTDDESSYPLPGYALEDFTGRSDDIQLNTVCGSGTLGGDVGAADAVLLPLGNQGESLTTSISVRVGSETVRDTDLYVGWG